MSHLREENDHLHRELDRARAETHVLRDVVDAPTPQHIVDSLARHLFSPHVIIASLWRLAPSKLEQPGLPFRYADLIGLYLRGVETSEGVGTRLDLQVEDPLLAVLSEQTAVTPAALDSQPQSQLLRSLLKSRTVENWAIFPLHTKGHLLGLLFVGLDAPLAADELQTYTRTATVISLRTAVHRLAHNQTMLHHERNSLLNAVNDGVVITDSAAVITGVNEAFYRLFNCHGIFAGMTLTDLLQQMQVPPSIRQQLDASWRHLVMSTHDTQQGDFEMVTYQGHPVEIHWYSAPIIAPNQHTVFARMFIFHDATPERKAVQVRSAFLSRVSHELRTPLTSISGFAEFILESSGDELPQLAREYVEIIHESAGILKQTFSELIEITRAQAGELMLDLQPTNLKTVIQSVVREYMPAAQARQQAFQVTFADDLPPVQADPERMTRVFASLIWNAIQYTPPEGDISVGVHVAATANDLPGGAPPDTITPALVASVIDSGEGIHERDVEQVFEPFYRTKNAWVNQTEGTGLGLAVSRSLVELHRGKIWIQPASSRRKGGRFFLALPIVS